MGTDHHSSPNIQQAAKTLPKGHIDLGVDAVVLTALGLEWSAVARHLNNMREVRHPDAGTLYVIGELATTLGALRIALAETGAGNASAAIESERALALFSPRWLLFVGVAGGLKDVTIGDVVAASKVYLYESGKAGTELRSRPELVNCAHSLVQRAKALVRDGTGWLRRAGEVTGISARAYIGAIAAGEKVVASSTSTVHALLRDRFGDALAVEMEGYGALRATLARRAVEAIVVRGISDLIDEKAAADASGSQERAAANAAAFAMELLSAEAESLGVGARVAKQPAAAVATEMAGHTGVDDEFWQHLSSVATELYQSGPSERDIWSRAGGDLAQVTPGATASSSWYRAIRDLKLGGGGRLITPKRLLRAMREDYPQAERLAALEEAAGW
jgi:adenosylhomocysteine nucleosidase